MKVAVTFDIDEKNLDDLVVMAKVYRKKDGYKEFVSVKNNLPLRYLPQKKSIELACQKEAVGNDYGAGLIVGWNECLDEIIGDNDDEV